MVRPVKYDAPHVSGAEENLGPTSTVACSRVVFAIAWDVSSAHGGVRQYL